MLGPLDVPTDKNGEVLLPVSEFTDVATPQEMTRTGQVRDDFQTGHTIMNRPYREFNDRSLITYTNDNQQAFNSYIPPRSQDPDDSWRAQTVRPVTRNKLISIAAHITAQIIVPTTNAQNRDDEEDRQAAKVMNDLIEWTIENTMYERKFVDAVIAALVNPATILHAEYVEVMRTVRQRLADGEIDITEAIDDVLSGFQTSVVPSDQLFISNIYEKDVQRQRFLVRRQFISYDEAAVLYHDRENFRFVKPGIQVVFVDRLATFYEQNDEDLDETQVEVATYYNRGADLQITMVNGIMMDDPNNPNPRVDKLYPFAKSGYEPVDEGSFFYYKSAADKLGPDQELVDTLYNMVMDGTFLQLMPPMATFGNEELDSNIFVPGSTHSFREDTKIESIAPPSDLRAGLAASGEVERSMSESSTDPRQSGIAGPGEKTAFEVERLEVNARVNLGLFGKMIGFLVEDYGTLMVGDILQHYTVGQVMELTGGDTRLNFRKFLLPNVNETGRSVSRQIEFTTDMASMGEEDRLKQSLELFDREGGFDATKRIVQVNPTVFRELKFKVSVDTDAMLPKSKNIEKALRLEAYDRMIQNPLLDPETVTREFLVEAFKPGESDRFMSKKPANAPAAAPVEQTGVNDNLVSQMTGNNSLGNAQLLDTQETL